MFQQHPPSPPRSGVQLLCPSETTAEVAVAPVWLPPFQFVYFYKDTNNSYLMEKTWRVQIVRQTDLEDACHPVSGGSPPVIVT